MVHENNPEAQKAGNPGAIKAVITKKEQVFTMMECRMEKKEIRETPSKTLKLSGVSGKETILSQDSFDSALAGATAIIAMLAVNIWQLACELLIRFASSRDTIGVGWQYKPAEL